MRPIFLKICGVKVVYHLKSICFIKPEMFLSGTMNGIGVPRRRSISGERDVMRALYVMKHLMAIYNFSQTMIEIDL